jgi:hypothetical protein
MTMTFLRNGLGQGRELTMSRVAYALTVIVSTLILFGVSFLTPSGGRPSDDLAVEAIRPFAMAALLSLVAGYVASQGTGNFRSGALCGAVNAAISLGLFLLAATIGDRHFRAIGGPSLLVGLPLIALVGALFGALGVGLRRLTRAGGT